MNNVQLIGRIVRDIELKYTAGGTAVARFAVAVDRPVKEGAEKQSDFPSVVAFGKQAETIEKFFPKGARIGLTGRLQTGSYKDKDGRTVYTTDVVVTGFDFCESRSGGMKEPTKPEQTHREGVQESMSSYSFRKSKREQAAAVSFDEIDEDVPF